MTAFDKKQLAKSLDNLGIDYAEDKNNPTESEIITACCVYEKITHVRLLPAYMEIVKRGKKNYIEYV